MLLSREVRVLVLVVEVLQVIRGEFSRPATRSSATSTAIATTATQSFGTSTNYSRTEYLCSSSGGSDCWSGDRG